MGALAAQASWEDHPAAVDGHGYTPVRVLTDKEGDTVDQIFDIRDVLGAGSFGKVYRGVLRETGDEVAFKVIAKSESEPGLLEKFGVELLRRALTELRHENVIRYFAFAEDTHNNYVAMALLRGPDLCDYFGEQAPLSATRTAEVLSQAVAAIAFLHDAGVVHRDVKPDNFMFETQTLQTLKLIDFGSLALETSIPKDEVAGSIGFCAPEALAGGCCRASDVFSLGVMMAIALTGRFPAPMGPRAWQDADERGDPNTLQIYKDGLKGLESPGAVRRWLDQALPGEEHTLAVLVASALDTRPSSRNTAAELQQTLANFRPCTA